MKYKLPEEGQKLICALQQKYKEVEFLEMCEGLEQKECTATWNNVTWDEVSFYSKSKNFFLIVNKQVLVDNDLVVRKFLSKFNLKRSDVLFFLKEMFIKHFKIDVTEVISNNLNSQ